MAGEDRAHLRLRQRLVQFHAGAAGIGEDGIDAFTFERLDQQPQGMITIHYEWGQAEWALPTRTVLNNGWFGYELTIVTHSETRLDDVTSGSTEEASQ